MNGQLEDVGYFLLFVYSFGGGFIGIATAAVFSSLGKMSILLCILLSGVANFAGSTALFYFARNYKSDALVFLKKHRRKLALAHLLMKKHGFRIIFIQKFIYGIKTIVPLAAGITKYNAPRFIALNFAASFLWALAIGLGAYFSSTLIIKILLFIEAYPFIAPVVLISALGGMYFYMVKTTKRREII